AYDQYPIGAFKAFYYDRGFTVLDLKDFFDFGVRNINGSFTIDTNIVEVLRSRYRDLIGYFSRCDIYYHDYIHVGHKQPAVIYAHPFRSIEPGDPFGSDNFAI